MDYEVPAEEVRLVLLLSGPDIEEEEIIVGRQGLRVGRSSDNNLPLRHGEISRQHMRILWRDDDKYLVEDLNSSNGVWLNDTRLVSRVPAEINPGDVIRVGPFVLRVDRTIYAQAPVVLRRFVENGSDGAGELLPPIEERFVEHLPGIPRDKSNWLQYLPSVYHDDLFFGRFLLIFESLLSPIIWIIDNFDMYLSPEVAPEAWLQWMSSWFDLLLLPELPLERQREIMRQAGWLFLRRGTPAGLQRLLELYFDVMPEIIEDEICHFTVRLPLSQSNSPLGREVADRLINSQRPAFASYTLEVT